MTGMPLLTVAYALPLFGALVVALLPRGREAMASILAFFFACLTFMWSLLVAARFEAGAGFQLVEQAAWIPGLGVTYRLGLDGLSLPLLLLTSFLAPVTVLSAYRCITHRRREFYTALLALVGFSLGSFLALDLVLFYLFFELMLVPMFLIIGIWGGEKRVHAAVKFVLFTVAGSLPFLLAVIGLRLYTDAPTYALPDLLGAAARAQADPAWAGRAFWLFLAFALAFAIKVPMVPVHTWLPDAHGEAPTPGSVWLAGVLLKVGAYGFLRFALPLFPATAEQLAPYFMFLGVVGIVYGALLALAQENMKRLVAYSSISHMGYIILGIFALNAAGASGAVFQMVAHGLTTGGLFIAVGMLYERRHTLAMDRYGGVARVMPWFATAFMVVLLGSAALPGLCGFVGEFLVLLGAARIHWLWAATGGLGVILGAAYLLTLYRRLMFGPLRHEENAALPDLTRREGLVIAPMAVLIVLLGLIPYPVLRVVEPAARRTLPLQSLENPRRAERVPAAFPEVKRATDR